ncbi:MAG: hypothetical protein Q9185_007084 [Variospora sp. 1 TL-2023]
MSTARSAALFLEVEPINPEVQALYDYFFIPEAKDRVLSVFKNIEQFNGPNDDKTNPKEVVVYCDISRYVERKDEDGKTLFYDPDINQAESEESLIKGGCGTPTSGAAMAYTVKQRDTSKIQQIQICPWYMNFVASVEYKVARTNTLKGWFFRLVDAVQSWWGTRTTMDALSLFDSTMLHELTHTRDAGGTEDLGAEPYGWKNCVDLKERGGFNNADSLALFALAAEVWSQGVGMPQLDGSIRLHQQQAEGNQKEKRGGGSIGRMWRA